jgi:hypothetical protein
LAIDVLLAEGGGLASAVHELVEGVDTLHILHDAYRNSQHRSIRVIMTLHTEGEVGSYPGSALHEVDSGGHEALYLALRALSAAIEVLRHKSISQKK